MDLQGVCAVESFHKLDCKILFDSEIDSKAFVQNVVAAFFRGIFYKG